MRRINYLALLCLNIWAVTSLAQSVPSPADHFGFDMGADYRLANYTQTAAYFKKLDQSDRVQLVDIGDTEEGRTQYMLVISSPENMEKLATYKDISTRLAYAEGLDDATAKSLAATGKAVVWIDGGLHATEMVGSHQLIEMAYQLTSNTDEETLRILDDVIVLLTHANPDGHELVANWYMRHDDPEKRAMDIPRLYQKYIGHDNNRDFYITNMKESENMSRQLFLEWMPQIMYNHHQSAPAGAVVAGPPYTDPFNYNIDPLLMTGIDAVGASMINRLNVEDKPGFTRLKGSPFSTWYNGGLRTTTYFHNVVGLLTEIIGNPTPMSIPVVPDRLVPNGNTPNPVTPQEWHFRQSIDYSVSLNYAVLDYASRHREQVLYNIYKMGKNAIEKGSRDFWQLTPRNIDLIKANYDTDKASGQLAASDESSGGRMSGSRVPMSYYEGVFANPEKRDARGYIISADQPDFPTAVKFINALIKSGIFIHKATADFTVGGKAYPAGSYVVKMDQAFRPHIIDMFEPQDYPNDFAYPGGPPIRPYDVAGWTLAYQMGIAFDRMLEGFEGPFERLPHGVLEVPPATGVPNSTSGYLLSANVNNAFIAVNDLLKAGIDVYRIQQPEGELPSGSFYIPAEGAAVLKQAGTELGVEAVATANVPGEKVKIMPSRIALFDRYGGSMPSGWVRWMLEQYHFAFSLIFPQEIDAGNLNAKYDAILFIENGIPAFSEDMGSGSRGRRGPDVEDLPEEYRHMVGSLTADKSIPQLKEFLENGGTILTTGSSTSLSYHLGLPVKNALVEVVDGKEVPLSGEKFYVPGSVLRMKVNPEVDAAWGMASYVDAIFNNSPVFNLKPEAELMGIETVAWFDTGKPLRSGWAWGQNYLQDGVTAFKAPVGKGFLYAYGPQITYRAQPHSTFKLLFNALYQTE